MLLSTTRHRFHPRTEQDRERARREAALRAQVSNLTSRIEMLEKEQQVQLRRIGELQQQLDLALPVAAKAPRQSERSGLRRTETLPGFA